MSLYARYDPSTGDVLVTRRVAPGLGPGAGAVVLRFTPLEWAEFLAGVFFAAGEFDPDTFAAHEGETR